jgi:isopenicillin N synthase-like dioxygenase
MLCPRHRHRTRCDSRRGVFARRVASACEEIGFFAVTGHGAPGAVIADLVAQSYAFFDLPLAEKLAVRRPRPEQNRGYIAPGEERLARLRGDETPPDLKELYTIGPFHTPETSYFIKPAAYPSFAPNQWPARPVGLRPRLTSLLAATGGVNTRKTGAPYNSAPPNWSPLIIWCNI